MWLMCPSVYIPNSLWRWNNLCFFCHCLWKDQPEPPSLAASVVLSKQRRAPRKKRLVKLLPYGFKWTTYQGHREKGLTNDAIGLFSPTLFYHREKFIKCLFFFFFGAQMSIESNRWKRSNTWKMGQKKSRK